MSDLPPMSDEASARLQADVDLIGRAGARELEVGYLDDDVPADEARWYAKAMWRGTALMYDDQPDPWTAVRLLAERVMRDAACNHCGKPISWGLATPGHCPWEVRNQRWQVGCAANRADRRRKQRARRKR